MSKSKQSSGDSSSDESFVWTDTSKDSDSDCKPNNVKNESSESEAEKKCKNEIKKEPKLEIKNLSPKRRKRKNSHSSNSSEHHRSPKKKKIKLEPESDVDHKCNNKNSSERKTSNENHMECDNTSLQTVSGSPSKRAKKKKESKENMTLDDSGTPSNNEIKAMKLLYEESVDAKTSEVEDAFSAEETTVGGGAQSPGSRSWESADDDRAAATAIVKSTPATKPVVKNKNKNQHNTTVNGTLEDVSLSEISISRIDNSHNNSNHNISKSKTKRISERIEFEDDSDFSVAKEPSSIPTVLKQFIRKNPHLDMFLPNLNSGPQLTHNDELWIIKCPKNVNISDFMGKDITFENKCKIKLDGQTYEGNVDNSSGSLCIVNSRNNELLLNNFPTNGIVNLHKRIPKLPVQAEDAVVISRRMFRQLPETKVRHPLFGSNYKKAIKIPSAVKARLNVDYTEEVENTSITKKSRKKEKNVEHNISNIDLSCEPSADSGVQSDHLTVTKKKKKKRKHSNNDIKAPPAKKHKTSKHNLEAAEAWESEQAIEENLFTF